MSCSARFLPVGEWLEGGRGGRETGEGDPLVRPQAPLGLRWASVDKRVGEHGWEIAYFQKKNVTDKSQGRRLYAKKIKESSSMARAKKG